MNTVLISCYDLGRQPFGLAEPAAWLRRAGIGVRCLDLSVEEIDETAIREADLIGFHVPMHTATRMAVALLPRIRQLNRRADLCFYGLYAAVRPGYFGRRGVAHLIAGEFESGLLSLAERIRAGKGSGGMNGSAPAAFLGRQKFLLPDRALLPPLTRYARLRHGDRELVTGYVEASRGCRHLCRHCPVVPVYGGRFRIVDREVVLGDIRQQVAAGARHIIFGDPDFFNAPKYSLGIAADLHEQFPGLTYDVTIKVEHLLRHREHLSRLRQTGCLFVTTAVESLDDRVLSILDKGHSRSDFLELVRVFEREGLVLSPTFIPFTPWTTLTGYRDLLRTLDGLRLTGHVAPIQLAIRLLVPPGSLLLERPEVRCVIDPVDEEKLVHPWRNPDPRVDQLQRRIEAIVSGGEEESRDRKSLFGEIWKAAAGAGGEVDPAVLDTPEALPAVAVPYLTEPWYC